MYYLNVFFLFSILGHFIESTFSKNFESGILYGYWTPVYGIGVCVILFIFYFLKKYIKNKFLLSIILFFSCGIILSILEVIGGYLIEFLFHKVFWNYKNHHFPIGKYTSLDMAFVWGISSLLIIFVLKPVIDWSIKKVPKFITWILLFLFILDCLLKLSIVL